MDKTRYDFNLFDEYESVRMQAFLHFLRINIDINYYYDKKNHKETQELINKILNTFNLTNEERIELERKSYYHLNKHIILKDINDSYNIQQAYDKRWYYEKQDDKKRKKKIGKTL